MKTINILSWIGCVVLVPCIIFTFGEEFVKEGIAGGFGYSMGYIIGIILMGAINIKLSYLLLIKKRDKEFNEVLKRLERLEE
jgi:uncharacterized membrane protein